MGSLSVRSISNALTKFVGKVLGFDNGNFTVSTGSHRITVPCSIECPTSVWVKFTGQGTDGCGQAVVNTLGYAIVPNNLIFDVEIKTDSCLIEWFAVS